MSLPSNNKKTKRKKSVSSSEAALQPIHKNAPLKKANHQSKGVNDGENQLKKGARAKRKALQYSDINLEQWRDYPDVSTDSLWIYNSRERGQGHQLDYHGNCIPQILTQLLNRYTKSGEIVLDLFLGSGTTAIEAVNMGRRVIGVELQPKMTEYVSNKLEEQGKRAEAIIIEGDSSCLKKTSPKIKKALKNFGKEEAQFVFLHPPYDDIIRFSELQGDLSTCDSTEEFLDGFEGVCQQAYDNLAPGRFAAVTIGDKYTNGELIPLGFQCMERMNRVGFKTKSIIVKNISGNEKAKGKMGNLWRYRALAGGFYVFKHEYVFVFEKPVSTNKASKKSKS
jgi:DNA modification methylase